MSEDHKAVRHSVQALVFLHMLLPTGTLYGDWKAHKSLPPWLTKQPNNNNDCGVGVFIKQGNWQLKKAI